MLDFIFNSNSEQTRIKPSASFVEKPVYKIILIGDSGVGKTSISNKYVFDTFYSRETNTIGVAYVTKEINVNYDPSSNEYKPVKLCIWDTAGQERFLSIVRLYYKHARGICCVYDTTNISTLHHCKKWIREALEITEQDEHVNEDTDNINENDIENDNNRVPVLLIGNKFDLFENKYPSSKEFNEAFKNLQMEIQYFEDTFHVNHYFTSAKTGMNLDLAFRELVKWMKPNKWNESKHVYIGSSSQEQTVEMANHRCGCS